MEIQSQSVATLQTVSAQGNSAGTVKTGGASSSAPVADPAQSASSTGQVDRKQLEEAVRHMDELINVKQPPDLAFSIDADTDKTVVRVTDAKTGDLIRQIPSEEALEIARSLAKVKGMLLKQEA